MASWEGKFPGLVHVVDDDASVRIAIERRLKPAGYEVGTNYILVVDDDPSMLTSMKRLLREHGFDAELFDSAKHR